MWSQYGLEIELVAIVVVLAVAAVGALWLHDHSSPDRVIKPLRPDEARAAFERQTAFFADNNIKTPADHQAEILKLRRARKAAANAAKRAARDKTPPQ